METTRYQIEDHTTTRVLPTTEIITESEGPKETTGTIKVIRESEDPTETNKYQKAETSIYALADTAINEADMLIIKSYFSGVSRDEAVGSLNKIKSILDTIKRESSRLYNKGVNPYEE